MLKKYPTQRIVAGCDEAGRGSLAGPVVAAATILPFEFKNTLLNDSKKLSKKNREVLKKIIENEAVSWGIGIVDEKEIDRINILNASLLAMHRAIKKLNVKPELLLIDGNKFNPYAGIKHKCVIKGDQKYFSIAASSILAKTYRDNIMRKLDLKFPAYNWKDNKGYPTKEHRKVIQKVGTSQHHRITFQIRSNQLNLDI